MLIANRFHGAGLLTCALFAANLLYSNHSYANINFTLKWRSEIAMATASEEKLLQVFSHSINSELNYQNDDFTITSIFQLNSQFSAEMQAIYQEKYNYSALITTATLDDHSELTLRELYIEVPFADHYLTLGKQQVVWGKADGIKILDVVNPHSFNEFIFDDFEQSRIPLWMLNAEFSISDYHVLQLLWIPDSTVHRLAPQESTFAVTSSRITPQLSAALLNENTSSIQALNIKQTPYKRPPASLKNSDLGLRLTSFINGWDISLNYLYHYEDLPVFESSFFQESINITAKYYRSHLIGGSFSNTFNDITLRSEVAYKTNIHQRTQHQKISQYNELTYLIGIDYFGLNNTILSGQFMQSHAINSPNNLTKPLTDTNLTLLVRNDFWHETLTSEILIVNNTDQKDGFIQASLNYDYNDSTKLWLASDIIWGQHDGLYGQFNEKDRVRIGFEISF